MGNMVTQCQQQSPRQEYKGPSQTSVKVTAASSEDRPCRVILVGPRERVPQHVVALEVNDEPRNGGHAAQRSHELAAQTVPPDQDAHVPRAAGALEQRVGCTADRVEPEEDRRGGGEGEMESR